MNKFKVGDKVRINGGTLKGEIATITKIVDCFSYKIDLDKGLYLWSDEMISPIENPKDLERKRQDKFWNELSEESKKYILSINKELEEEYEKWKKEDEDNLANNSLQKAIMLEDLCGEHNLIPKPKIWEDVEKEHPEYKKDVDVMGQTIGFAGPKIFPKLIATYKVAKLIDLCYGGMVSEEEWRDHNIKKYWVDVIDDEIEWESEMCDNYMCSRKFITFHTPEQRKEFMSYESNRQLVRQYFMM